LLALKQQSLVGVPRIAAAEEAGRLRQARRQNAGEDERCIRPAQPSAPSCRSLGGTVIRGFPVTCPPNPERPQCSQRFVRRCLGTLSGKLARRARQNHRTSPSLSRPFPRREGSGDERRSQSGPRTAGEDCRRPGTIDNRRQGDRFAGSNRKVVNDHRRPGRALRPGRARHSPLSRWPPWAQPAHSIPTWLAFSTIPMLPLCQAHGDGQGPVRRQRAGLRRRGWADLTGGASGKLPPGGSGSSGGLARLTDRLRQTLGNFCSRGYGPAP